MSPHRVLWILQWLLGLFYIAFGITHFMVPDGLPEQLSWMYDLTDTEHAVAGTAEILGGLGLILPALTRIRPGLTSLAAGGLMAVMVGAAVFHFGREEWVNIGVNAVLFVLLGYVAYGRWQLAPIGSDSESVTNR